MPLYFMDYWYIILVVPALLVSLYAQFKVKSTFKKYSIVGNSQGLTGAQAAARVLQANGVQGVSIEWVRGSLTDHYNPRQNVIRLSDSVYASTSVAAVGVACHEAGHAVQYAKKYAPIKIRAAIVPVTNFGSSFGLILVMLGLFLVSDILAVIGVILFSTVFVFQLVTLPVEFDASNRALKSIRAEGMLTEQELCGAKKTLQAAAMTYVAAMLVSLMNLLRIILRVQGNRNRRR